MTDPTAGQGDTTTRTAQVNLNADTSAYSAQMGNAARQTTMLGTAVDGLSNKLSGLTKRAGRKLELFGAGEFAALAGFTADAAAFDKQMSTLRATSSVTGTSFKGLKSDVESAFTKFPVARGEAVALTAAISNMGVTGARDIGKLDQTFIKLGASTGESMTGMAGGLIQLSRLMGTNSATQIGNYANALLTVSKKAGVSASGVLEFSQAIAPMARQAGIGEGAVLGISTAFSKAGADGYLAANVFNKIINDITNMTKTGSPELAKYANFVGMTAAQFKKLPGEAQITKLFAAVAKGGPAAVTFANDLGIGTRGLSSLQAVAKSGGLQANIATAEGASHDQKTLGKASAAAFNNLADTLTKVRNQFTEMGDEIGGPLLKPLTMLASGFAGFLHVLNSVMKAMGPLPTIAMALAGAMSAVAGIALVHAGLIGGLSAARLLSRSNSGPRLAAREGRAVGVAERAGAPITNESSERYAAGGMPYRARLPYLAAREMGRKGLISGAEPAAPTGFFSAFRAGRTAGPAAGAAAAQAAQAEQASAGLARMSTAWAIKGIIGGPAMLLNQQSRTLADVRHEGYSSSLYQPKVGTAASVAATNAELKARLASAGIIKLTTAELANLAKAAIGTTAEEVRAAAALAGLAASAAGRGAANSLLPAPLARAAIGTGRVAGRAAGAAAGALGAVGRAAFSLPGMLALGIGIPATMAIKDKIQAGNKGSNETDVINNLNPLQKYNDALGIATTNLASFSAGLAAGTPKAGTTSTATTIAGAKHVSGTDIANFGHSKSADKNISAIAKYGGKDKVGAAVQLMNSYAMSDPKQLDLFKQNLLASGFSPAEATKVLAAYKPGAKTDYATLAGTVNASQNHGMFASHNSKSGDKLTGAALGGINLGEQNDLLTHSAGYASTKQLSRILDYTKAQASGAKGTGVDALANTLATVTGGSKNTFMALLAPGGRGGGRGGGAPGGKDAFDKDAFNKMSDADKSKFLVKTMSDSSHGRDFLKTVTGAGGVTDPTKMSDYLNKNFGVSSDTQITAAKGSGALGRFATTDASLVAATGSQSGDPAAVQAATEKLADKAKEATGGYAEASGALMKLSDSVGGASTATGRLIAAAAAWGRTLQSFKIPTMSRNDQMGVAVKNMQASTRAAAVPGASAETVAQAKTDRGAYESQKEGQRQYLISVLQQAQSYGTQMERAQEDQDKQIYRSNRNFYTQMTQGAEDYHLSTLRSTEDFSRQLVRQAESSAQSIYNPFLRVQAQYTTDAGTLVQNLQDQNKRIKDQYDQLAQLRKMGVSQGAIDTLQLADPSNAQQLGNIVSSIAQNPSLIAKINKEVASRVSATTKLTQSNFSMSFRNTITDFNLSLNRASHDYDTAHDRAVKSQHLALSDMATDYNQMVSRSAADLKTSMTEIYGDYGNIFGRTMGLVTKNLGKYAPEAAAMIGTQLDALKSKYPGLFDPNWDAKAPKKDPGTATNQDPSRPGHASKAKPKPPPKFNAVGGIARSEMVIGEASSEALIPLDHRGQQFMAGMYQAVAKSVVQQMHTSPYPTMPRGAAQTSIVSYDQSTNVHGNTFELKGDSAKAVLAEIKAKERLGKLTSPVRH
jgi:hypothetical protein